MRKFQRQAGFLPEIEPQLGESVAHRMQIGFALDPVNGVAVAPGLRHVDVDGHLPQAALHQQLF